MFFGDAALALGLLSSTQVDDLLRTKREKDLTLEQALVQIGAVEPKQLEQALAQMQTIAKSPTAHVNRVPTDIPDSVFAEALIAQIYVQLMRGWDMHARTGDTMVASQAIDLHGRVASIQLPNSPLDQLYIAVPEAILATATVHLERLGEATTDAPETLALQFGRRVVMGALARLERDSDVLSLVVEHPQKMKPLENQSAVVHQLLTNSAAITAVLTYPAPLL